MAKLEFVDFDLSKSKVFVQEDQNNPRQKVSLKVAKIIFLLRFYHKVVIQYFLEMNWYQQAFVVYFDEVTKLSI